MSKREWVDLVLIGAAVVVIATLAVLFLGTQVSTILSVQSGAL
jgi:hypothetical protein